VLSSLWVAAVFCPLLYSLLFPTQDIQHLVAAFEGRETPREEFASFVRAAIETSGHAKRVIQVGAYWQRSAEYKSKELHTTRETELSYLAWFEKRSKPTILIITRTQIDESSLLRFDVNEGSPIATVRAYLPPLLALAFSVYWFRSRRRVVQTQSVEAVPSAVDKKDPDGTI
jgi:hypothetical protein